MAAAGLADLRALRPGRRHPAAGRPGPGCVPPAPRACWLSGAVGYGGSVAAAERRHHPDQRHPRGAADRRRAGPGRDHRGAVAPDAWPARWPGPGSRCRWPALAWSPAAAAGGGARRSGDGLVLASLLLSATFTVAQVRLLRGRDPVAVTAVQFLGAALAVLPFSVAREGLPRRVPGSAGPGPGHGRPGRGRHAAAVHPVRLRAEPGVRRGGRGVPQHRAAGRRGGGRRPVRRPGRPGQVAGGAAILAGIALSSLPLLGADLTRRGGAGTEGTAQHQRRNGARMVQDGNQPRRPAGYARWAGPAPRPAARSAARPGRARPPRGMSTPGNARWPLPANAAGACQGHLASVYGI